MQNLLDASFGIMLNPASDFHHFIFPHDFFFLTSALVMFRQTAG